LFQPDLVHKVFIEIGIFIGKFRITRFFVRFLYGAPDKKWVKVVDGITYYSPVLLSAGFDYNGHLSSCLWDMGFGGEEVGSVTAKKCLGNKPPNLTRLINSQSILFLTIISKKTTKNYEKCPTKNFK
jgi:hypothetical protein